MSLSDSQLKAVMAAASVLPRESREDFLKLIADQLKIKDVDVGGAVRRAADFIRRRVGDAPP